MIFKEKATDTGFTYTVEDVFGTIDINSAEKLDGTTLDALVLTIMRSGSSIGMIGPVSYMFKKSSTWLPDEESKDKAEPLKKGQCPNCRKFNAHPLGFMVAMVGLAGTVASLIGFIIFIPVGILMMLLSLAAIVASPFVPLFYPRKIYCLDCKQTSQS